MFMRTRKGWKKENPLNPFLEENVSPFFIAITIYMVVPVCTPTPYLLHHLQISYTSVYYIWLWNLCIFLCISFILLKNNVTNKGLSKNLPILNVYWSRKEYWLTVSFWVGDHERQMQVIAKFQSLRARQMNFSELWQPRHSSSIFNGCQ